MLLVGANNVKCFRIAAILYDGQVSPLLVQHAKAFLPLTSARRDVFLQRRIYPGILVGQSGTVARPFKDQFGIDLKYLTVK